MYELVLPTDVVLGSGGLDTIPGLCKNPLGPRHIWIGLCVSCPSAFANANQPSVGLQRWPPAAENRSLPGWPPCLWFGTQQRNGRRVALQFGLPPSTDHDGHDVSATIPAWKINFPDHCDGKTWPSTTVTVKANPSNGTISYRVGLVDLGPLFTRIPQDIMQDLTPDICFMSGDTFFDFSS